MNAILDRREFVKILWKISVFLNIPFDNLINYPGIQWKLLNIKKMPNDKETS